MVPHKKRTHGDIMCTENTAENIINSSYYQTAQIFETNSGEAFSGTPLAIASKIECLENG